MGLACYIVFYTTSKNEGHGVMFEYSWVREACVMQQVHRLIRVRASQK